MRRWLYILVCCLFLFGCVSIVPSGVKIKGRATYIVKSEKTKERYKFSLEFIWGFSQSIENEKKDKDRTGKSYSKHIK